MTIFFNNFKVASLIMVRLGGLIFMAPFFSSRSIPWVTKVAFAFLATLILLPLVLAKGSEREILPQKYFLLLGQEIVIGLFLGFLVLIIFSAFRLSAEFFSMQIGFNFSEAIDPYSPLSGSLIGQLKVLIGFLVFLALNGHHLLLEAVFRSYELVPLFKDKQVFSADLLKYLVSSLQGMFVVALKISFPIVAVIFLLSLTMGLFSRIIPQMNVMMFSFPVKIIVALIVLMISAPLIVKVMYVSLEKLFVFINQVLEAWPI